MSGALALSEEEARSGLSAAQRAWLRARLDLKAFSRAAVDASALVMAAQGAGGSADRAAAAEAPTGEASRRAENVLSGEW